MTGIERLRAISGAWDEWGLGGTLTEIADQIEQELARHDEPDSTDKGARLLYVMDEDREALEWVRNHGGLDHVREEWRSRVPYDRYERRRQNLLRHIAECETALGRRRRRIEELGHRVRDLTNESAELRKRTMPEGCEWPRFEDNDPLEFGDKFVERGGVVNVVASVEICADRFEVYGFDGASSQYSKGERVKRPVLDADGVPICGGECVWGINGGLYHVTSANCGEVFARHVGGPFGAEVESAGGEGLYRLRADRLTHTKPEPPDSAERIADEIDRLREEVALHLGDYLYDEDGNDSIQFSMELVAKRCRALAERERGE